MKHCGLTLAWAVIQPPSSPRRIVGTEFRLRGNLLGYCMPSSADIIHVRLWLWPKKQQRRLVKSATEGRPRPKANEHHTCHERRDSVSASLLTHRITIFPCHHHHLSAHRSPLLPFSPPLFFPYLPYVKFPTFDPLQESYQLEFLGGHGRTTAQGNSGVR